VEVVFAKGADLKSALGLLVLSFKGRITAERQAKQRRGAQ
jgi:hypothetical protein